MKIIECQISSLLLVSILSLTWSGASFGFDHSYGSWSSVLQKYLNQQGLVNYKQLKTDIKTPTHSFNQTITELTQLDYGSFQSFSNSQKKAFLINAYNALTIKLILDHYPVSSIKSIGSLFSSPWSTEFFSLLGGQIKSLDPIEHKWLRPQFKDFRIHAAVNCASISCPSLRHEAYVAEQLDRQLDEQMKLWLNDQTRNQLSPSKVKISKIFDWYESDFTSWGGGIVKVLNQFAPAALAGKILPQAEIEFLDYNWNLNQI